MNEDVVFPFIKGNINNVNISYHYVFEKNYLSTLPVDTIGVHWYGGNKNSQKYNSEINAVNYVNYDNTMSAIIKKITLA